MSKPNSFANSYWGLAVGRRIRCKTCGDVIERCKTCGDVLEAGSAFVVVMCGCKTVYLDNRHGYELVGWLSGKFEDAIEEIPEECLDDGRGADG